MEIPLDETQNTRIICFSWKISLILKFSFSDICEAAKRKLTVVIVRLKSVVFKALLARNGLVETISLYVFTEKIQQAKTDNEIP